MSKPKAKNWGFKKPNRVDPALASAIRMAEVDFNARKKAREIMAVNDELNRMNDKRFEEMTNEYTDWDLGCAALVLHRMYKKNAAECAKFLTRVQELTKEFIEKGITSEQIWEIIRVEIGLDIERDY